VNNQRDHEILRWLFYGPAVVTNIFLKFFNADEKSKRTRWRVMLRRLQKMQKARLIDVVTDNRARERIIVLAPKGAELVCKVYSLDIENAWLHSGKDQDYYHDLTTAIIARRFVFNVPDDFTVDLHFEFFLKKERQRRIGNVSGIGYPDFRVHLYRKNKEEKTFEVERDCSTVGRHAFEKKLRSSHSPLLVVTDTKKRANWLIKNAMSINAPRSVYVTLLKELPQNVYSSIKCWSIPDNNMVTIKILDDESEE